jgi:hypothetical protein
MKALKILAGYVPSQRAAEAEQRLHEATLADLRSVPPRVLRAWAASMEERGEEWPAHWPPVPEHCAEQAAG